MRRTLEEQDTFYKELARFTCAEKLYEHRTKLLAYSEGVRFLVEKTNAQWLLDLIVIAQPWALSDPWLREFQLWEVFVGDDGNTVVVCSRDLEDAALVKRIGPKDFPLDYVHLYLKRRTLLLPRER